MVKVTFKSVNKDVAVSEVYGKGLTRIAACMNLLAQMVINFDSLDGEIFRAVGEVMDEEDHVEFREFSCPEDQFDLDVVEE